MGLYEEEIKNESYKVNDELCNLFLKIIEQNKNIKIIEDNYSNLGIESDSYLYHKLNREQKLDEEYKKTLSFLEFIKNFYNTESIKFINYGDTELIFVIEKDGEFITLTMGQPRLEHGNVIEEFKKLKKLAEKHKNLIIEPRQYITNVSREAFTSPYLMQARCVASLDNDYGAYIPEPKYRFRKFTKDGRELINKLMIANLVRTYDSTNNLGIADCKIGGGDFILDKETDKLALTVDNFLDRMHLIAARKLIEIDMQSYLKLLRDEFTKVTYYSNLEEKDKNIIINDKNRVAMTKEEVEEGIKLGLKLRN